MAALALAAVSISEQIKTVGAYAGLAAILGLAILAMLYFAQARELRRLREWAGSAPERGALPEPRPSDIARRATGVPARPATRASGAPARPASPPATGARAASPAGRPPT
ncbi:MAG TPA: hypothetical protein VGN69_02190, partial [Solirubrobacteraceae bacterium]|nr:hypothetical protein [Solirubrobacteraceae bacterium]